jgi:hypothetical protein
MIRFAGGAVPEVPAATQGPNDQISEVRFETVDLSGCFSNFVSKIEDCHPDRSIQMAYNKAIATFSDPNGIRTRVLMS